jgi:choline dehydrogenase
MFCDAFQWHIPTPPRGDYLTVIVDLLRPLSRAGSVTLASSDARVAPSVNINFLSEHLDIVALREGVRFVDDVIRNGEGMKDLLAEDDNDADYPWPMPRTSDEAMNKMILERMQTGFRKFAPCLVHTRVYLYRLFVPCDMACHLL